LRSLSQGTGGWAKINTPAAGAPTRRPVSATTGLPAEVEQLMRQLKMPYARALAPQLMATAKAQR
jgi:hypothetical protein